jgi:acyl-CoA synthetase (NDP forming)
MIDVDWGDLIYYLADDLGTRSILLYMAWQSHES